jgi:hypothetical protein
VQSSYIHSGDGLIIVSEASHFISPLLFQIS